MTLQERLRAASLRQLERSIEKTCREAADRIDALEDALRQIAGSGQIHPAALAREALVAGGDSKETTI